MSALQIGSFVKHAKMLDLGSGQILSNDNGAIRIRFASGERNFIGDLVSAHLATTLEAPVFPSKRGGKRAVKAAPKAGKAAKVAAEAVADAAAELEAAAPEA